MLCSVNAEQTHKARSHNKHDCQNPTDSELIAHEIVNCASGDYTTRSQGTTQKEGRETLQKVSLQG